MPETLVRIALDAIVESAHNPRKHFDDAALADLAESLRTAGQLTPIIVRPAGDRYELAAGHRRFRAAQRAGLTDLLAIVREYDDATFLEVLTIENLQREDVHPLEEADAFRTILQRGGMDLAALAAKVGKSVRYVRDRMHLLRLIAPLQTLYFEGHLTLGHALEMARCPVPAQERMLEATGNLWQYVQKVEDPNLALESEDDDWRDEVDDDEDAPDLTPEQRLAAQLEKLRTSYEIVSVSDLKGYIRDEVRLDVASPELPSLFPDVDPAAVASGVQLSRDYWVSADDAEGVLNRNQYRDAKAGECDHVVVGLHVLGPWRGRSQAVCTEKLCEVHWPTHAATKRVLDDEEDDEETEREESPWEKERRERLERNEALVPLLPFIRAQFEAVIATASTDATGLLVAFLAGRHVSRLNDLPEDTPFPLQGKDQSAAQVLRAWAWQEVAETLDEHKWDIDAAFGTLCESFGLVKAKVERAAKHEAKKASQEVPA